MPLDFGRDCPYHVYLNGECTEVHFGDGSLLYTIEMPKSTRGTGVSTKLLKDKSGTVKYILTQERNKDDIYQAPTYFITAVRPEEGGRVFKTGHGHIGRVYQDGYDICVSFCIRDSTKERASLENMQNAEPKNTEGDAAAENPKGESPPTTGEENGGGLVKRWFCKLLGLNKKHDRFVALIYDGRGKWIYMGSNIPDQTATHSNHDNHNNNSNGPPPEKEKDIVLAHKEAEDAKKGFLGLRPVTVEPGNEWLRDMVVAAWLVVFWEEERWSRLPVQLRDKGLEYLGGSSGGNGAGPAASGTGALGFEMSGAT